MPLTTTPRELTGAEIERAWIWALSQPDPVAFVFAWVLLRSEDPPYLRARDQKGQKIRAPLDLTRARAQVLGRLGRSIQDGPEANAYRDSKYDQATLDRAWPAFEAWLKEN